MTPTLDTRLPDEASWDPESGRALGVLYLHTAGDLVALTHASVAVTQATRIADLVVRLDTDELVVVMPGADHGTGRIIVARIADILAGMPDGAATCQALSVGVASGPADGRSIHELLNVARRRADTGDDDPQPVTVVPHSTAHQDTMSWRS